MRVITAQSPNHALKEGLAYLNYFGIREESRSGDVLVAPSPVMTIYTDPSARVLVGATRDANPFFHLFESLWMLAGRNDLAFPKTFVSTFGAFSDDGLTLHGAYGHRWRSYYGYDQLDRIIKELIRNPTSRRCVLQMWDPGLENEHSDTIRLGDLDVAFQGGKDVPCNTAAYFDTVGGKLNMTVTCRSNDVILGAYGANIVHMSFLLEYMAAMTDIPMGVYRQFSNNYHVYENQLEGAEFLAYGNAVVREDVYCDHALTVSKIKPAVRRIPLMGADEDAPWHRDLALFMALVDAYNAKTNGIFRDFETAFFTSVVGPMWRTWLTWKAKDFYGALDEAIGIKAGDWQRAASVFVTRRMEKQS